MPSKTEARALRDIMRQIDLAIEFTADLSIEQLEADLRTLYAVTRCLEIISEASRRLSDELKARHPEIPWRNIAGAGNVYRHDYEDVTGHQVWQAVKLALPPLRAAVEQETGAR